MASLIMKYVDADQWDAEDIPGRLVLVLHAAFLLAGFQPYGAQPPPGRRLKKQSRNKQGGLSRCLSRRYTAPELAHQEGAEAAVLMLREHWSDATATLLVFLTTTDGDGDDTYLECLDFGPVWALWPFFSRSLGDVERRSSALCKWLAYGVCCGILDDLCRRNGLPLSACFNLESLPDDLKGAILAKLTDGKDLARVECVSSQLRLLVAERDHELWKALYKALPSHQRPWWFFSVEKKPEILGLGWSWKNNYVLARQYSHPLYDLRGRSQFKCKSVSFDPIRMFHRRELSSLPLEYLLFQHPPAEEEKTVFTTVGRSGGHRRKLAPNDCKKWYGGGAIHSPSSRYRWKHR